MAKVGDCSYSFDRIQEVSQSEPAVRPSDSQAEGKNGVGEQDVSDV